MPWFKVDDSFYDHPKVLGLDMSAIGLWTVAGTYCARHLTDGVVTDKQIRAIGGTRRQAEKLVAAGLWSVDDAPPSERRYAFHDWRDFQPSRAEVTAERERARERMAAARAKKQQAGRAEKSPADGRRSVDDAPPSDRRATADDSRASPSTPGDARSSVNHPREGAPIARVKSADTGNDVEMFGRTNAERSGEVRVDRSTGGSPYPDPTRPDPTHKEGEVVGQLQDAGAHEPPPSDESWDEALAAVAAGPPTRNAWPSLEELAQQHASATPDSWSTPDDPRCREHATWSREDVPACGACGRARRWFEDRAAAEVNAHRSAIDACDMCDDRGLIDSTDAIGSPIVIRCDHTAPPETPKNRAPSDFRPTSDPQAREALLKRLNGQGGPF